MGRIENVLVFEDTEKICKENEKLKESVKKSTESHVPPINVNNFDPGIGVTTFFSSSEAIS